MEVICMDKPALKKWCRKPSEHMHLARRFAFAVWHFSLTHLALAKTVAHNASWQSIFVVMHQLLLLVLCAALTAVGCQSHHLIPFEKKDRYGYYNAAHDTIIQPTYVHADSFSCGWGRVAFLRPVVDSIFIEGYFGEKDHFRIDTSMKIRFSYVNSQGQQLPHAFRRAYLHRQCIARVQVDSLWGYLDKNGKWLVRPQYVDAENFNGHHAIVREANDTAWRDLRINQKGQITKTLSNWYEKPTYFDSIAQWENMLALAKDYIKLGDPSTSMAYYRSLLKRLDEVRAEDTLATMEILCRYAYLSAEHRKMHVFHQVKPLADKLFEDVVASQQPRRRLIMLEYIDFLARVSKVYQGRDQFDKELEMCRAVIEAVKKTGTEEPSLYWDVQERIDYLENR